jgi:hypothetical protein
LEVVIVETSRYHSLTLKKANGRRKLVQTPVAVEKLLFSKSAKIKLRQEAPQSILSGRPDIFYPPNFGC